LAAVERNYTRGTRHPDAYKKDPTYIYLDTSGMLDRGWISARPLKKAIAIKHAIGRLEASSKYADLLMLALLDEVVTEASNIKFGPQPYCALTRKDAPVFEGFHRKVSSIIADLEKVRRLPQSITRVLDGDSRECSHVLRNQEERFSAVVCSPPYPGEHDYTRHSRLELAFLEEATDRSSLQAIKRQMLRSNTKGIYRGDNDAELVARNSDISRIVANIRFRSRGKTHGFARLYPTVVQEYFGGMKRHLMSLAPALARGARCAYVLGDQASYVRVQIPTARILAQLAEESGYRVIEVIRWRTAWATRTARKNAENILMLEKAH
jgi:hypothetical protein